MIHVKEAVIVEGIYDKIKLSSILDAVIIETHGFSIFRDKKMQQMIRRLALSRGVLILTDSDRAGFMIRSFIGGALPRGSVKNAYIPDLYGKESRKSVPSKEGKLGVEGVPIEVIVQALRNAGVLCEETAAPRRRITKADLYEDGLSGTDGSFEKRQKLIRALDLPARLSANGLLDVLNGIMDYEEYRRTVETL